MSRRISGNKGFVGLPVEENDDDEDDSNDMSSVHSGISRRRSLGGRRRSSFGSHSSKSPGSSAEQSRIAEMYKNVIKMSSENKINDKNSWNLDLIDHMGNLIKGDATGSRGVNFQKASCTLDASVKIYSHRVDDTHSSSQAMVESLTRTFNHAAGDDDQARGVSRVGTKSASSKLNIAHTIASSADVINAAKIERVQATDPMFYKMSKAFDDGGAKGMLMTNLRVSPLECSLSFSSAKLSTSEGNPGDINQVEQTLETVTSCSQRLDISDLISRCGFDMADLLTMSICPALLSYRETIGIEESLLGAFDPLDFPDLSSNDAADGDVLSSPVQPESDSSSYINNSDFDYQGAGDDDNDDDDDNNEGGYGGDCFADSPVTQPRLASARKSLRIGLSRRSSIGGPVQKIQWDMESSRNSASTGAPATPQSKGKADLSSDSSGSANSAVWDARGISCSNEYSFFDLDMVNKSNSWAGARHWNYATRRQAASNIELSAEPSSSVDAGDAKESAVTTVKQRAAASKALKGVKEKFFLRPMAECPLESLFAIPKAKTRGADVTFLTAAALGKEECFAEEGGLFLPPDAKLQTSDLCRLMLCNNIIVPPPLLAHVFMKLAASSSSASSSGSKGKGGDVIWGQVRHIPVAASSSTFNSSRELHDDDDDDDGNDGGGYYAEDFCDPDGDEVSNEVDITESVAQSMEKGLFISSEGLLRANRTVNKIDIGFATVSKKVNVKRLKVDIWTHLDELQNKSFVVDRQGAENSVVPDKGGLDFSKKRGRQSLNTEEMSFQDLVCDITTGQRQKDVTLPFYFICLLHLANEKTLKIDGSPDMSDLFISKDS